MPNWKKLITSGSDANLNSLTVTNSVTAANFETTSDIRLKTEIQPLNDALNLIKQFTAYEYIKDGKKEAGFIAQELKPLIKYTVREREDGYLVMNDRPILAYLHKAILELEDKIQNIEKRIKNIEENL